jgi:hypothetical protein
MELSEGTGEVFGGDTSSVGGFPDSGLMALGGKSSKIIEQSRRFGRMAGCRMRR